MPRLYRCDEVPMIRGHLPNVRNFAAAQELVEDSGMTSLRIGLRSSPEKFVCRAGFSFSAVAAGIKVSGRPDLALVEVCGRASDGAPPSSAALLHLFTKNRVVAAPVEVGRGIVAEDRRQGSRRAS
jgi:hypothetical protein